MSRGGEGSDGTKEADVGKRGEGLPSRDDSLGKQFIVFYSDKAKAKNKCRHSPFKPTVL